MNNEALIKAAEEINLGLALHEPLEGTKASKKNIGGAIRVDAYNSLIKDLDEDQAGAAYKIAIGWRIREAPSQLKSASRMWWGIPSKGYQDASDTILAIQAEFDKWWVWMTIRKMIDKRSLAIDVCALGKNFTESSWSYNISDKTAKKYVIEALDQFIEANKKEYVPTPVIKKERRAPVMNPTKVIHFVD